jgi:hypothetical protein
VSYKETKNISFSHENPKQMNLPIDPLLVMVGMAALKDHVVIEVVHTKVVVGDEIIDDNFEN